MSRERVAGSPRKKDHRFGRSVGQIFGGSRCIPAVSNRGQIERCASEEGPGTICEEKGRLQTPNATELIVRQAEVVTALAITTRSEERPIDAAKADNRVPTMKWDERKEIKNWGRFVNFPCVIHERHTRGQQSIRVGNEDKAVLRLRSTSSINKDHRLYDLIRHAIANAALDRELLVTSEYVEDVLSNEFIAQGGEDSCIALNEAI
ncbi:hypothetical protein P691DRAFT_790491 [Macrolepiota fuliginosa MF-IS2]|uniref:Uncharacterized protein n=1 Tax=Macrolepiota fuliginosa MF-IS2 TaxID=1400762 RepID=A0A9P5X1U4_9AGAR|nr:hypothetical protein P691DRAFT_790491 [Macrolepiota fuliginosa MF-IS2]